MWRFLWSAIGIAVMYYEMVVDQNMADAEKSGNSDYQPSCDISFSFGKEVSCSKILKSEYAVGFGILQKVTKLSTKMFVNLKKR